MEKHFSSTIGSWALSTVKEITYRDIRGKNGFRFLHLKLTIITMAGKYAEAYEVISKHIDFFDNYYDLLIAQGIIAWLFGMEMDSYLYKALEQLRGNGNNTDERAQFLKHHLPLVLGISEDRSFIRKLYHPTTEEEKAIIDYYIEWYENLSIVELIVHTSPGFFSPKPFLFDRGDSSRDSIREWWLEIEG